MSVLQNILIGSIKEKETDYLLMPTVNTFLACFLRWKGDCGGKKQLWFPANYVEEISPSAAEPDRAVSIKPAELLAFTTISQIVFTHVICFMFKGFSFVLSSL